MFESGTPNLKRCQPTASVEPSQTLVIPTTRFSEKEESAVAARELRDYRILPLTFPAVDAAEEVTLPSGLCTALWHVSVHVFVARL